jgi:translation initiation factor IF-2
MGKIRVGQLAKDLGLKVTEAIAQLRKLGVEAKTNLSMIDEQAAARLRAATEAGAGGAGVAAKPAAPGATARASAPAKMSPRPATAAPAAPRAATPKAVTPSGKPAAPGTRTGAPGTTSPPASAAGASSSPTSTAPVAGSPRPGPASTARQPAPPVARGPVPASAGAARPAAAQPPGARPGIAAPVRPGAPRSSAGMPATGLRPGAAAPPRPLQGTSVGGARPATPPAKAPAGPGAPRVPVTAARPATGARPLIGARPGTAAPPLRPVSAQPLTTPAGARRPTPAPPPHRPGPAPSAAVRREPAPPLRPVLPPPPSVPEVFKDITITEGVTVKELSEKVERKAKDIITKLMGRGILATINQPLDTKIAVDVCHEMGFNAKIISFEDEVAQEEAQEAVPANLRTRDPVVTIMGHVDHGKTSLLDAVRESNIAAGEAGGITQHIGAYHIRRKDRGITFIDTPGHEAFTMMRARGARVTDVVILVIAADDGVMPQTTEAVHHARAAGVPMVVAINKIDKPGANLDRVKKQLSDQGLLVEDWGGDVVAVPISAKQKTGINELLEMILLVADMADLKADPTSLASGTVLDARLDKSRGPVATILVQRGTLRIGDPFIAGAVHGKVRAMFDDLGHRLREAGPSIPVEVLGLEGVPGAGDAFQVLEDEWKVRQIGAFRQQKLRHEAMAKSSRLTLDHLFQQIKEGTVKELPLVVKADVQGSVEALAKALNDLPSDKVKIRVIHSGSGAISETDVNLAAASNAIIIGYNVRPERGAQELSEKEKVDIRLHSVIYDITNEIKSAMVGMLEPEAKEVYLGRAEVRQIFKVPKIGAIAGCLVSDGRITRSAEVRLLRDNVVVHTGKIGSLRRFKDDASEVKAGYECGIGIANYNDLKVGDVIEAFKVEKVAIKSL